MTTRLIGPWSRNLDATWMADAGIPLHVLQRILGHKSIETTRGYLHPDTRHLASAAAQANAFLDAQEQQSVSARRSPVTRRSPQR